MRKVPARQFAIWPATGLLVILASAPAPAGARNKPPEGSLVKLQSIDLGGFAYHISYLLTPTQSLVRIGEFVVTVGGTAGGMAADHYDYARLYKIRADGKLRFVRT